MVHVYKVLVESMKASRHRSRLWIGRGVASFSAGEQQEGKIPSPDCYLMQRREHGHEGAAEKSEFQVQQEVKVI